MGIDFFHIIGNLYLLFKRYLVYLYTVGAWGTYEVGHCQSSHEGMRSECRYSCKTTNPVQSQERIPVILPIDLIEYIADFLFEIAHPPTDGKSGRALSLK